MGQNGPDFIDVENGHGSLYYRMLRQEGLSSADGASGEGTDQENQHSHDEGNSQRTGRIERQPEEQGETGGENHQDGRPEGLLRFAAMPCRPMMHVCAATAHLCERATRL